MHKKQDQDCLHLRPAHNDAGSQAEPDRKTATSDPKDEGIVCIDPLPRYRLVEGSDQKTDYTLFTIQVDKLPALEIPAGKAGFFKNLSVVDKHLIKIDCDGKRLTSFWFTFQGQGATHLQLWYYDAYGSWCLSPAGKKHKCPYEGQEVPLLEAK